MHRSLPQNRACRRLHPEFQLHKLHIPFSTFPYKPFDCIDTFSVGHSRRRYSIPNNRGFCRTSAAAKTSTQSANLKLPGALNPLTAQISRLLVTNKGSDIYPFYSSEGAILDIRFITPRSFHWESICYKSNVLTITTIPYYQIVSSCARFTSSSTRAAAPRGARHLAPSRQIHLGHAARESKKNPTITPDHAINILNERHDDYGCLRNTKVYEWLGGVNGT
ncbi:uncharacterized protein F4812DRAFT_120327 [Daldinia caldariorum]|uniref:uncharacterized protein n=1 Tax=Daldinia caldariorum TaxID=326644 RepID=UPI0020082155|nr:uncharacterized protein F4812DRAFT_120327 [Daldinia caldariorum]KAI1465398.1 hypothetical protein F4812DRAFT_120327 [Daldinia caldariorum]